MKSKCNQMMKPTTLEKQKDSTSYDFHAIAKQFDFVGLYKTAAETSKILEKSKTDDNVVNKDIVNNKLRPKHERMKGGKKNKFQPLGISQIVIDASSFDASKGAIAKLKAKPAFSHQTGQGGEVKSIMKNATISHQQTDNIELWPSTGKPTKRNKSVSFMLDDTEEVVVKRTKSEDSVEEHKKTDNTKSNVFKKKKITKKNKNELQSEKENTANDLNKHDGYNDGSRVNEQETNQRETRKIEIVSDSTITSSSSNSETKQKNKKHKTTKGKPEATESNKNEVTLEKTTEMKLKKKKVAKHATAVKREGGDGDGEPVLKHRKKEAKPDLVEDLENLSIGDNTLTLTSMLDEMTVVDKDKRKKLKQQFKKSKKPKHTEVETEKTEEVKEKEKWQKRKWNKDKKGEINSDSLENTVIVENLPLAIMMNYKKLLTDYFIQFGLIKKIGMAEVYPTEDSKPVFTTTIIFNSDGAAKLALEEDNAFFKGARIRVKRPLPPTATTIVARSYAELTDQSITTLFHTVGKIRSIRHLVKGKKSMATTFIEFDGPEAVERAIRTMTEVKIGGKKVHVARFELRPKKKKERKPKKEDNAADTDSEDSND